ncbi:MAG TPA: ADOP family duplicated permease [Gemmatimonadaceae bacterium]|nr:ADOP family duplicated permease [Gemmatimonadaceae bacterium]
MEHPRGIRRLLRFPAGRRPIEREIDDEIAFHFDATVAEFLAQGLTPEEARREAARRFGDVTQVRRDLHQIDSVSDAQERRADRMGALVHDVRSAVRALVKDRRVSLFVVITLMLGLGANATMFGIVDRLLLRPPPHVSSDPRLTSIYIRRQSQGFGSFVGRSTSYPGYAALRDERGAFSDAAAYWSAVASLGRGPDAVKVNAGLATANFFPLLGVRAERGRFFAPDEDRRGNPKPPVVLSHGFWQRQFGGDAQVIGREIQLNQGFYTIVGVAPQGFNGASLYPIDAWIPMHVAAPEFTNPTFDTYQDMRWLEVVAQRRSDVSAEAAAARATATYQRLMREARKSDSTATILLASMVPARGVEGIGGMLTGKSGSGSLSARVSAWLAIVAAIVLAIACANVANLLLLRAARRRREIALRLALGISRARLATQLLLESTILATVSGLAALALVPGATQLLRATLLGRLDIAAGRPDLRLVLFTAGCVLAVGVAAGLAPLALSRRMDVGDALKAGVREGSVRRSRLRTTLLVMQGALSMLLLIGAGLFVRSLRNVARLDLGFDPDRVMVAQVDLSGVVKGREAFEDFWRRALEQVAVLPSVGSASQSVTTPLESGWALDLEVPDRDSLPPLANGPYINAVSPSYFTTMGMRIVKGRAFTAADDAGAARVSVISDSMARYLFPGQEALGKCYYIVVDDDNRKKKRTPCITVIGISQNTRVHEFREGGAPEQYVPISQSPSLMQWRVLMVRARDGVPAANAALDVRRTLQSMGGNLPFADVRLLREPVSLETRPWELGATMFGLFGTLALVIAAVGLYSTIAYEMAQRAHEFGVRQALGAQRGDVGRLVVGRALRYALPGLILGVGLALLGTRAVRTLLFDVSPVDPVVYVGVGVTLLAASLLAAIGPARRAWRVDPIAALREE